MTLMMKITLNVPKKNVIYGSMKFKLDLMEKDWMFSSATVIKTYVTMLKQIKQYPNFSSL